MNSFYKLLILFFTLPLFSLAQRNYKPGYVVTLKGDTMHGYIDYKEWDQNPTKITYKSALSATETKSFSINDASAFAITGFETYQRFVISASNDVVDITKIETSIDTTLVTDTVFLRVSNAGKYLTLYSYTDKIKERFYYLENGETSPKELGFHAYLNEGSNVIQYIRLYRTQLEVLAEKHKIPDNVIYKIVKAEYSEPELIKIAEEINGPSSKQFTQQSTSGSRWFAGIGAAYNRFKFDGVSNPFPNSAAATSYSPTITFGFDAFSNKNVQRFFVRIEYTFEMNKYKVLSNDNTAFVASSNAFNFTQYNNSLVIQAVLNLYNKDSFKVFIGAGIAVNLSVYNDYGTLTSYPGTNEPNTFYDKSPELSKFWASFPLNAGVTLNKKIELNFRYIPVTPLTDYDSFSGAVTSYQLGVNYLFGK